MEWMYSLATHVLAIPGAVVCSLMLIERGRKGGRTMQASSINQGREISKDKLLKIAPFSKGQLTKIYRAGYLPRPQRRSRPGSNKPVYFWDESVVEQATLVYDLLQVRAYPNREHTIRGGGHPLSA